VLPSVRRFIFQSSCALSSLTAFPSPQRKKKFLKSKTLGPVSPPSLFFFFPPLFTHSYYSTWTISTRIANSIFPTQIWYLGSLVHLLYSAFGIPKGDLVTTAPIASILVLSQIVSTRRLRDTLNNIPPPGLF
jgi:hypothetical protein